MDELAREIVEKWEEYQSTDTDHGKSVKRNKAYSGNRDLV